MYVLQLAGILINCSPKLVALTFVTNSFCNRVVNVWNRLPASDCHFNTFKTVKSFLNTQTLTALLY